MPALRPTHSPERRRNDMRRLGSETWDLLVVGGGITGVAVARDAALRGLSVALLEQFDLAFGTSSRSSRLIHGGLRYLESFELELVHEGLVERRRLLDAAPGLVRAVQFLYPVYPHDPEPLWKVHLGTWAYDTLAGRYRLDSRRLLRPSEVLTMEPELREQGLRGAICYSDGASHDARLTIAVALSAAAAGATILTRTRVRGLLRDASDRVTGVELEDGIDGTISQATATAVALCTGPWQDLHADIPPIIRTARGTHISVPADRAPVHHFIALHSPRDGRLTFALPHGDYTVFGTTDDDDPVDPGAVNAQSTDIDYLLEDALHALPGCELRRSDVCGAWAGLRPLIADPEHDDPDELSRRHQVVAGGPGLWILAGGKLTTHRRMAEDLVDAVVDGTPGLTAQPCRTSEEPLLKGNLESGRKRLRQLGCSEGRIEALEFTHGVRTARVAELAQPWVRSGATPDDAILAGAPSRRAGRFCCYANWYRTNCARPGWRQIPPRRPSGSAAPQCRGISDRRNRSRYTYLSADPSSVSRASAARRLPACRRTRSSRSSPPKRRASCAASSA
jgi:glycerol-3-phosphate dehydrogenase